MSLTSVPLLFARFAHHYVQMVSTRRTHAKLVQRKIAKRHSMHVKYDDLRAHVIHTVKTLLDECDNTRGKPAKIQVSKKIYDCLMANKWFLERYDRFRYVVRAKLVEYISGGPLEEAAFLPYWKEMHPILHVGTELEVRIPASCVDHEDAMDTDHAEEAIVRHDSPKYAPFLDQLLSVYRERDENFEPSKVVVLAFKDEQTARKARAV